jgi:hypothetical protein
VATGSRAPDLLHATPSRPVEHADRVLDAVRRADTVAHPGELEDMQHIAARPRQRQEAPTGPDLPVAADQLSQTGGVDIGDTGEVQYQASLSSLHEIGDRVAHELEMLVARQRADDAKYPGALVSFPEDLHGGEPPASGGGLPLSIVHWYLRRTPREGSADLVTTV